MEKIEVILVIPYDYYNNGSSEETVIWEVDDTVANAIKVAMKESDLEWLTREDVLALIKDGKEDLIELDLALAEYCYEKLVEVMLNSATEAYYDVDLDSRMTIDIDNGLFEPTDFETFKEERYCDYDDWYDCDNDEEDEDEEDDQYEDDEYEDDEYEDDEYEDDEYEDEEEMLEEYNEYKLREYTEWCDEHSQDFRAERYSVCLDALFESEIDYTINGFSRSKKQVANDTDRPLHEWNIRDIVKH